MRYPMNCEELEHDYLSKYPGSEKQIPNLRGFMELINEAYFAGVEAGKKEAVAG